MKIAILYSVWTGDDMDMLKRSIEQHRNNFLRIYICWQNVSNKGEICSNLELVNMLKSLQEYIVPIMYHPNLDLNTKENERVKHNLLIQHAKEDNYTHFILSACDHFYEPEQFEFAKKWHENNPQVDLSVTKMVTYYKQNDWCLYPLEAYGMPFIHKIYPETEISKTAKYPIVVDPSVKVNTSSNVHVFPENEVILHHYSMVRRDIQKKFRNAASSIRWTEEQVNTFISEYENAKVGDKLTYFGGLEIVEKEKVFNLLNSEHE